VRRRDREADQADIIVSFVPGQPDRPTNILEPDNEVMAARHSVQLICQACYHQPVLRKDAGVRRGVADERSPAPNGDEPHPVVLQDRQILHRRATASDPVGQRELG
jgi:hypothetical protein